MGFIELSPAAEAIPDTAEWVARFGAGAGLDRRSCFQIQVVVAEALNNIVEHGHAASADGVIRVRCAVVGHDLEITIRDDGRPFDRLPSERFPAAQAEGGRGWPIIVNWADSIEYRCAAEHNELTLRKTLPA